MKEIENKIIIRHTSIDYDVLELVNPSLYGGLLKLTRVRHNRKTKFYYNLNTASEFFCFKESFPLAVGRLFCRFVTGPVVDIIFKNDIILQFEPKDHIFSITKRRGKFEVQLIDEIELFK